MKKILLRTLCLTAALPVVQIVSCGYKAQGEYVTNITSPFFSQLQSMCFDQQLKNINLWNKFVEVFRTHEDTKPDAGPNWRCEFWGKMMRGAVMCYKYSHDEQLYGILTQTVNDLLGTQDEMGRISTYDINNEFHSWDVWGRKYVMTALLHYYDICKDDGLKDRIIEALKRHADYILDRIGPEEEGKIPITNTGYRQWKGLNSCTIIEPMVNLYEVTKDKKYLNFATYIINTGGVSEGNMIEAAKSKTAPWLMPVKKAYESMSFFEGVYRYGKVVHNQSLIDAALNYFSMVAEQEITVIGAGGWEEEQWHNGVEFQTLSHTGQGHPYRFGQETCVTVTWMRILNILYEEMRDFKYYEQFANSAMNAFLGSLNVHGQKIAGVDDVFPFDTYSPLCNEPRGINGGGVVKFLEPLKETDPKEYGCCQCNAPVVVGLMGLNYCRPLRDKLYLNEYYDGTVNGDETQIKVSGNYLVNGKANVEVSSTSNVRLMLRIPSWAHNPVVKVNGKTKDVKPGTYGYAGVLNKINTIEVDFNPQLELKKMNDKMYFTYGPYVLAYDEFQNTWLQPGDIGSFNMQIENVQMDGIQQLAAEDDEFVRFSVPFKWGDSVQTLILTNYSSAGRHAYYSEDETVRDMVNVFFRNDY